MNKKISIEQARNGFIVRVRFGGKKFDYETPTILFETDGELVEFLSEFFHECAEDE